MFDDAFERTVGLEGGYTDDPMDSGGPTKFGITQAVARANGYTGSMRDMSLDVAKAIYRRQYWDTVKLDEVGELSAKIASELFDTGVNRGIANAAKYLQRSLNAFNRGALDYPDMDVDGVVGPMTIHALRRFLALRGKTGEVVMLRALNALQGADYIMIAEMRPKDERFVYGWFNERVA